MRKRPMYVYVFHIGDFGFDVKAHNKEEARKKLPARLKEWNHNMTEDDMKRDLKFVDEVERYTMDYWEKERWKQPSVKKENLKFVGKKAQNYYTKEKNYGKGVDKRTLKIPAPFHNPNTYERFINRKMKRIEDEIDEIDDEMIKERKKNGETLYYDILKSRKWRLKDDRDVLLNQWSDLAAVYVVGSKERMQGNRWKNGELKQKKGRPL